MTRQKTAAARQREGRETKEAYFGFPAFCMKGVIRHCVIHAVRSVAGEVRRSPLHR